MDEIKETEKVVTEAAEKAVENAAPIENTDTAGENGAVSENAGAAETAASGTEAAGTEAAETAAAGTETAAVSEAASETETAAGTETAAAETEPPLDPEKAAKKKKARLIAAAIGAAVVLAGGGGYVLEANTYQNRFVKGTTINGTDVSNLSAEQVEELFKEQVAGYTLTATFPDGSTQEVSSADMKLSYEPDGAVEDLLGGQNRFTWAGYLFGHAPTLEVAAPMTYEEKTVMSAMKKLPAFQDANIVEPVDAHMEFDEKHMLKVAAETYGTRLDEAKVMEKLASALAEKSPDVSFEESDYVLPSIYADDKKLNEQIADINDFLSTKITLTLHDDSEYVIDAEKLKDWLAPDPDHEDWYIMDDETFKAKALEEAAAIAEKDNVVNNTFTFKSSLCGNVNLRCPKYGCTIDEAAEGEQIYQDVMARGEIERTPNYSWQNDYPLGSSYIEIDIGHQQVFVFNKGKQVLHTYCVSGTDTDPSRRSDRGFFHVTWKTTDHVMRGPIQADGRPSYESHINYGVYYNGGEALHDASWRDSFGGSTYLYSGSHGCINLSNSAAATVYNNSWVGMPVIVFN